MRLFRTSILTGAGLALASSATAQIALNELYVSHRDTDDMEFIELIGQPGTSLDGIMIMVVEGDQAPSGTGELDRLYDLTGDVIPASSYYVVGDSNVPNVNFVTGGANSYENSTATFYLVSVPDANQRALINSTWLNSDISTGPSTTMISSTPGITILDLVGIIDADMGDTIFDGALSIGPDGTFFPAGVFRPLDCPNDWCTDVFLDFEVATPSATDHTPGAQNVDSTTCMRAATIGTCSGAGQIGSPYCMVNANSTGSPASLVATGSAVAADNDVTLTTSSVPLNAFGYFLTSLDQGFVMNPGGSEGNICLAGSIGRYVGPGQIQNSGSSGELTLVLDLTQHPTPTGFVTVMSGETWNFQTWFRDMNMMGSATSNFSNGLEVMFQ